MMQLGFFTEETRLEKLTKLGDSLEKLSIIDWGIFRPILISFLFTKIWVISIYNTDRHK